MLTIKERFESAYPLANYDAVYARLVRNNKDKFYEAMTCYEQGIAVEPFSSVKQVNITYFDTDNLTVGHISASSSPDQFIGYDTERGLFYVYSKVLVINYPTIHSYVEHLIENIIKGDKYHLTEIELRLNSYSCNCCMQCITKDNFDKVCCKKDNLSFGVALEAKKLGKKVKRASWLDDGFFLSASTWRALSWEDLLADDWKIVD